MSEETPRFTGARVGGATGSIDACTFAGPDEPPSRYRLVAPDGSYDPDRLPELDADEYRDLFEWMVIQQVVDERMVKLQRRGEMGTYASGRGQEASIVGFAAGLNDADWLYPYGREAAAMLYKGMSLRDLLLYWRGVEDANRLSDANVFPIAIAIGTHVPIATGHAMGMAMDGRDAVAGVMMGDGHPSTGEAQAGMNFAGAVDAPAVFYVQNNGWSISCPFDQQTAARSVAQKAVAWGFPGVRVDGNDVLAVYDAVRQAREQAAAGGPMLVESVTYRLDAHTTNDDPSRYRSDAEVDWWEEREPLSRFRSVLRGEGLWDDINEVAIRERTNERFDEAKAAADAFDPGGVGELFDYVHADLPPELQRQREAFIEFLEARPDAFDYIDERPKG